MGIQSAMINAHGSLETALGGPAGKRPNPWVYKPEWQTKGCEPRGKDQCIDAIRNSRNVVHDNTTWIQRVGKEMRENKGWADKYSYHLDGPKKKTVSQDQKYQWSYTRGEGGKFYTGEYVRPNPAIPNRSTATPEQAQLANDIDQLQERLRRNKVGVKPIKSAPVLQPWSYRRGENNRFFGGEYIGGTRAIKVYKDEIARREKAGELPELNTFDNRPKPKTAPVEYVWPLTEYEKFEMRNTLPTDKYNFPPTTSMKYGWDFGGNRVTASNPVNPLEMFGHGADKARRSTLVTRQAPGGYPPKPILLPSS